MTLENRTWDMMAAIKEDMDVYDIEDNKIGTVEAIHFGDEDLAQAGAETASAKRPTDEQNDLAEAFREVLSSTNALPEEIRERLIRFGFVKVDAGLLRSDRLVLADQIAAVTDDRVRLKVGADDLITT
jgi:hypothetical protein